MTKAFTILELLIVVAIFSIVTISLIGILVSSLNLKSSQTAAAEVNQQSQFLVQQLKYYISSARVVDMPQDASSSALQLREFSSSTDPTVITLASGTVNLRQGVNGPLQALSSNQVNVSQLSFTRHYNVSTSSAAYGTDSVSYSFTMTATSTNNKQFSQAFQASVAVFAPIPKIVLLQQAKTENGSLNVSSIAASYPSNNETSSLLLALVANTTATATVSVSDTAGNSWNLIASTSYPAYNTKLTLFDALNAKNSSNTVTATLGTGAGFPSIFIYEYRGAATSSSFDSSSSQIQASTAAPSSGLANPTSTVELLFGATYNGGSSEVPSPGYGFSFETSSTVSYVFAEDMNQYVTGPVGATWLYSGVTSSSVLIATFK